MTSLFAELDSRWLFTPPGIVVMGLLLCSSTYIFTKTRYAIGSLMGAGDDGKKRQPRTLPYWIPFVGNSIFMTTDAIAFYSDAGKESPPTGGIVAARIGPMYMYIISGASNIATVFRNPKTQMLDRLFLKVYQNAFKLPSADSALYAFDDSGHGVVPLTNVPEDKRIWKLVNGQLGKNLQTAEHMRVLSAVFNREFQEVMSMDDVVAEGETDTILLWRFFRDKMTTASSISLMGKNLFKQDHIDVTQDFWIFFTSFFSFFMRVPSFMMPKAWEARERLLEACVSHLRGVEERYEQIQEADLDWDPDFGARVNRLRDKANRDCGVSVEGRGSLNMGFMMGINGNAIPVAGWILLELVQNRSLLAFIREEIKTAILSSDNDGTLTFDINKLVSLPLLSSVYMETLRLRMSTTSARQLRTDLDVGGYTLKKDNWVMMPSHLAQIESYEWASSAHPPTEFWAERFMDRKPNPPKQGTFFPFGGGDSMCPGRFFAKQEILIAIAVMVMKFEMEVVEIVGEDGKGRKEGLSYVKYGAGAGGQLPDGDLKCRIRRA